MSNLNEETIRKTLQSVKYPGYSRDIVSFGLVQEIRIQGGDVSVQLRLTSTNEEVARQLKADCETALRALSGVKQVRVEVSRPSGPAAPGGGPDPFANQNRVPGVERIVAVASGKGGVGKSTLSVNLACALQRLGRKVGLLDCDIYGPSIPLMMGARERPGVSANEKLIPLVRHDVKLMSIGFLVDDDQPVIWRGPMIQKALQQFLFAVEWGELDYLLVDLPPGTGDAQLTLCQSVPLDGGVVITTPQQASVGIVRKGIAMFQKVNVPVLGIVENMSYFTAPNGERVEIFGHGGGRKVAEEVGTTFLGEVPLFTEIRESGDQGVPVVVSAPDGPAARAFFDVANRLLEVSQK